MEEILKQILSGMNEMKNDIAEIGKNIKTVEHRLDRLEKMDSIEHRVEVNQIDLTDIKEILEKMDSFQTDVLKDFFQIFKGNSFNKVLQEELNLINQRLDAQLTKIAKNEEAILMIEGKNNKVS
ncbi:hypothetical protein ACFFHH_22255 [Cytobacillus solani]|uniref:Uncharacterized protein n=1 Tax=Cytobacillus solani TaxID=1637975 RepID=A0A0Q3SIE5_9BACI|nr:hypothetical protein [Cytobacillus solani]KOP82330.1 hypothetical protein AMS60_07410 [Bacillus sp. FJAT-21945]KQL19340.1 hypothetical protein AN957_12680 [Cytobacillus solani]USK57250.1 hypothetical protein LIS82_12610 [Cytobacillus solani]